MSVRRQLILGVYGSPSQWREACEYARDAGWTEREVRRILFWYHPLTWIVAAALTLIAVASYWELR